MPKANTMQLITIIVLSLIMAAIAATLVYQKLLGGKSLYGRALTPSVDIDQLNAHAQSRGWTIDSTGSTTAYLYHGSSSDGMEWTLKSEDTQDGRFGGGMHKTGTSRLVPITRWIASTPQSDSGAALIWPKPDNMPPDVFNKRPGEGMSIAGMDIGKFIVNTVLGYQFGTDSRQFDNAGLLTLGSASLQKIYAVLTSNQPLAQRALTQSVDDNLTQWSSQRITPEPPQILLWDKGIEITVFQRVGDVNTLDRLVDLGLKVAQALR